MTEQEAKTQPCIGPENCGSDWGYGQGRFCVGSACGMAWRWIDAGMEFSGRYASQEPPAGDGWRLVGGRWERPYPTAEGYCGLAGKP